MTQFVIADKISVIIPLYNQSEYICNAIDSVLNQSYPNVEIIVVNDGSTDNSILKLKRYEGKITLINQANQGLSAARNKGILSCSGNYIQFLDADDFLHPEKLTVQLKFMSESNYSVSYCEIIQYYQETGLSILRYVGELEDVFPNLYNTWHTYPCPIHSLLFKKEIFERFGNFPESLYAAEDRFFLSLLSMNDIKFQYIPLIGGSRRQHTLNMTKNRLHIYQNMIQYYKSLNQIKDTEKYLRRKFGFGCLEMINANMTFMYYGDIVSGASISKLRKIRHIILSEDLQFYTGPIPNCHINTPSFFMKAFILRWLNKIKKSIKR